MWRVSQNTKWNEKRNDQRTGLYLAGVLRQTDIDLAEGLRVTGKEKIKTQWKLRRAFCFISASFLLHVICIDLPSPCLLFAIAAMTCSVISNLTINAARVDLTLLQHQSVLNSGRFGQTKIPRPFQTQQWAHLHPQQRFMAVGKSLASLFPNHFAPKKPHEKSRKTSWKRKTSSPNERLLLISPSWFALKRATLLDTGLVVKHLGLADEENTTEQQRVWSGNQVFRIQCINPVVKITLLSFKWSKIVISAKFGKHCEWNFMFESSFWWNVPFAEKYSFLKIFVVWPQAVLGDFVIDHLRHTPGSTLSTTLRRRVSTVWPRRRVNRDMEISACTSTKFDSKKCGQIYL